MILQPQFVMPGGASATPDPAWWNLFGDIAINDCLVAYQPIGAADLASSYINLVSPGVLDAVPGSAPTLSARGWEMNQQWIETGVAPHADMTMIVRAVRDGVANNSNGRTCGVSYSASGIRFFVNLALDPSKHLAGYGAGYLLNTPALSAGIMAISGNRYFINGGTPRNILGTWIDTSETITVGKMKGAPETLWHIGAIAAFALYDRRLTDTEIATLTTAMNAL